MARDPGRPTMTNRDAAPECSCEEFWPGQGHPPDCPTQRGRTAPEHDMTCRYWRWRLTPNTGIAEAPPCTCKGGGTRARGEQPTPETLSDEELSDERLREIATDDECPFYEQTEMARELLTLRAENARLREAVTEALEIGNRTVRVGDFERALGILRAALSPEESP